MFDKLIGKNEEKMEFNTPFHAKSELVYKFKGGLKLVRTGDGHKRPMIGGPTKGWINIKVSFKGQVEELVLYARGTQGLPEIDYEPVEWNGFVFAQAGEGKIVVKKGK